jgi:hypothetical protein
MYEHHFSICAKTSFLIAFRSLEVLGQPQRVTPQEASIHNLIDILINNLTDILIHNLIDMRQPSFRVTLRLQADVAEEGS